MAEPLFVYTVCYFFCAICNKKGLIGQIILVSLILVGQTVANNLAVMRISSLPEMQTVSKYMLMGGILFGPSINFFYASIATETAFYAHKNGVTDLSDLEGGTLWYSKWGAQDQIVIGLVLLPLYISLFTMLLCGCCSKKPKNENLPPQRPENEDEDVKNERDRVQAVIDGSGNETLLVKDLVKKYTTVDPSAGAEE